MRDRSSIVFWAGGKFRRVNVATRESAVIPVHVVAKKKIHKALRFPVDVAPDRFEVRMPRWPQFSPDGSKALFQALGRLYIADPPGGEPKRLTESGDGFEFYPSFSLDGQSIVYTTWDDERLFLTARLVNSALIAKIHTVEWTPAILDHPTYGAAARDLFANARKLLGEIVERRLLTANGVYGFFTAASEGDDIIVFAGEDRRRELARLPTLRQQRRKQAGKPQLALADFIAPAGSGAGDYIGAFAVTAGIGLEETVHRFEREHDDYNAIMAKALADRLAEAFAELLHERTRNDWGYRRNEKLSKEELIAERYRGIRPAPGYPACPDHTEKRTLFDLLQAERSAGITLTETFAMHPAASVCGLYFAHPDSRYFTVGKIGRDQVASYAARKGMTIQEVERWLAPNLDYEPLG